MVASISTSSTPTSFSVQVTGVDSVVQRFRKFPDKVPEVVRNNFMVLGQRVTNLMRKELKPVHYTGETEASVSSEIDVMGLALTVGPTAKQGFFIRMGTRPHWAPIEPLKKWAYWKLGDEKAAWAIQRSIAYYGTSRWLAQKGIEGAEQMKDGIGLNFPKLVMQRGDFQKAVENTARRLGTDLKATIEDVNVF